MSGVKGRSGGARIGAGAPPGSGGAREGAGRPEGAIDIMPRELNITARKWQYAEKAIAYADEAIEKLVKLMRTAEAENVQFSAAREILDRAIGKAPKQVDATALRHTEIVYSTPEDIKRELLNRGVPQFLLDYDATAIKDDDTDDES